MGSSHRSARLGDVERSIRSRPEGVELAVRVIPRAGASHIAGLRNGAILARVAAAPVDGAANNALVALLSQTLKLPARTITIAAGGRSRDKDVFIRGVGAAVVRERLAALLR